MPQPISLFLHEIYVIAFTQFDNVNNSLCWIQYCICVLTGIDTVALECLVDWRNEYDNIQWKWRDEMASSRYNINAIAESHSQFGDENWLHFGNHKQYIQIIRRNL